MLWVTSSVSQAAAQQLEQENWQLRAEVERLKHQLVDLEIRNGSKSGGSTLHCPWAARQLCLSDLRSPIHVTLELNNALRTKAAFLE